jgi:probable F420-dependent oxidoreductase
VARADRAAWFDEAIGLIRSFWTGAPVTHHGARFSYTALAIQPRPAQSPPDIWLGGIAPSELRRVGRLADGWLPSFITPDEAAAGRVTIEAVASDHDRALDPEHYGALVPYSLDGIPDRFAAAIAARRPGLDPTELVPVGLSAVRTVLERFVDRGFSKFVLIPVGEPDSWSAELEALALEVLPLQGTATLAS